MKINIARQNIYILILSIFLFLFVILFSFSVLIPEGKNYRKESISLKKESKELRRYEDFHAETLDLLKKHQSESRAVIIAFDKEFNPQRFIKQNSIYFNSLSISEKVATSNEDDFVVYEVNTTSKISTPKSFYDFLEALNKSDWMISVDFPINFKRDNEMIKSTFSMKVYSASNENNTSSDKLIKK